MSSMNRRAQLYIASIIALGALISAIVLARLDPAMGLTLAVLCGLASAAQVLRVPGATSQSMYHISWALYGFAFVAFGAPAALLTAIVAHLVEWAWHRYPWHVQAFNIATYGVMIGAAEAVRLLTIGGLGGELWTFTFGLLTAAATFTVLNHLLVGTVIWLSSGQGLNQSGVLSAFTLLMDSATFGLGAAAALIWSINPAAVLLIGGPLYLIYSTLKVPALKRQTQLDPKTGLYNARFFQESLERELSRADRFDRPITVVVADLDLLRNINNTYGHLAGDQVLLGVANILKAMVREYDIVARFGGEEFTILMPETAPETALERIESIRAAIEAARFEVPTSAAPIAVTMSFGVAGRVQPRQTATEIMHAADVAVYQAKLAGRNRIVLSEGAKAGAPAGAAPTTTVSVLVSPERVDEAHQPHEPAGRTASRPHQPRWNLALTSLLVALAVAGSSLAWQPVSSATVTGILVFMGLALLTEWLAIELYSRNTSISTTGVVLLAGTALFGPLAGLAVSVTFVLVNVIRHRRPVHTVVFNLAQSVITSLLAHGVFQVVAHLPGHWAISLAGTLAAAMLSYVLSTGAIGLRMSLTSGRPLSAVWREHFSWLWPYYIAFGVVAYGVTISYAISGWLGVAVMLVPVALLRFSQSQYISRTTQMVSELRQKNAELVRTSQQLTEVNEGLIKALSQAIDLRDPFVEGHSQHVARYAVLIARELGLSDTRIEHVRQAALLHDLGKLGIPDSILLKTERLTTEEYELVKRHAPLGAEMIERLAPLAHLAPFIRHHHERFDGCGYPEHLSGDSIPLEARILSVADTVEAMASDRPYRPAQPASRIMNELRANLGTQFDPVVVAAFERVVARHGTALIVNSAYSLARLVPELTSSLRAHLDAPTVPPVIVATGRQFRH